MSLVSIIMPAYNAAEYISASVDSVLAQTYGNWELIIIDDGSKDATATICKSYVALDNRVNYYYQENGKQGKARNLGIAKSRGSLLAFLDADDLWLPAKLQVSIEIFQKGECDLLFTDAFTFGNYSALQSGAELGRLGVCSAVYKGKDGLSTFLFQNRIPMLTVLVKKEVVKAVGCFQDRGVAEDYELWIKLLIEGYVLKGSDVCLSLYRVHENATTAADKLAVEEVAQMFSDLFKDKPHLKLEYRLQFKGWLKRYLLIHANSDRDQLRLPSIFDGFNTYVYGYKLIRLLRPLSHRVFNYLLHKFL